MSVNITGEREYSYKVPIFAQMLTGMGVGAPEWWAKENQPTGWPGGLYGFLGIHCT